MGAAQGARGDDVHGEAQQGFEFFGCVDEVEQVKIGIRVHQEVEVTARGVRCRRNRAEDLRVAHVMVCHGADDLLAVGSDGIPRALAWRHVRLGRGRGGAAVLMKALEREDENAQVNGQGAEQLVAWGLLLLRDL